MTDAMLLRDYLDAGSQEAFAEMVRRHTDWVYHAALRMVRDSHLAEDVTQAVFMVLAKNGRKVGNKPLNAWLFGVMRYSAIHALRSRERERRRERQAAAMAAQQADSRQGEAWEELAGRLEDSVWRLGRQDRQAVLLRFYERKSLAEVGAVLGVSEDAARKRVARAVGQLKKMLGVAEIFSSAELAEVLGKQTTHAAPAALKNVCVQSHSMAASGAGLIAKGAMSMMLATKLKIAAAILIVLAAIPSAVGVAVATRKSTVAHPAAATQPAITRATLALRIKAASNLRQIGQALLLYAVEHPDGMLPPTFGDLIRSESISPQIFLLPGNPARPPMNAKRGQQADWVNAHSDFAYLVANRPFDVVSGATGLQINSPLSANMVDNATIVAAQKTLIHGDTGRNLLFGDGYAVWFPQKLADQLIARNSQPMIIAATTAPTKMELQDRRECAGDLRHTWQMILLYRYNHAGQYPPDLNALQIGPGAKAPPYDFNELVHLGENVDLSCPSVVDARIAAFRKVEAPRRPYRPGGYTTRRITFMQPTSPSPAPLMRRALSPMTRTKITATA